MLRQLNFQNNLRKNGALQQQRQLRQHPQLEDDRDRWLASLRGFVLISGFAAPAPAPAPAPGTPALPAGGKLTGISLPSLHVWGTADTMVHPRHSRALRDAYGAGLQRRVLEHDKGHVVPQRAGDMAAIADFLRYVQSLQPQGDAADAD